MNAWAATASGTSTATWRTPPRSFGFLVVNDLVALGVMVSEQFQIHTDLSVLQKANVHADPAVVKSGVTGKRGEDRRPGNP